MSVGTWASIINLTICFAIPLMLVALGGMYSERSGVINLALEGIMIIGALASTLFLRALDAAGWGESVFTSQLASRWQRSLPGSPVCSSPCCWPSLPST